MDIFNDDYQLTISGTGSKTISNQQINQTCKSINAMLDNEFGTLYVVFAPF